MELWLYKSRTSNECVLCFRHWNHLFLGVSGNYAGETQASRTRDVAKQKAFYSLAEYIYQYAPVINDRVQLITEVLENLRSGVYVETEVDEFTEVIPMEALRNGVNCNANRFRRVNSNDVGNTPMSVSISWNDDPRSFSQVVNISVTPMMGEPLARQFRVDFFELQSRPETCMAELAERISYWILDLAGRANSYLSFRVWIREITTQLLASIHCRGGRV